MKQARRWLLLAAALVLIPQAAYAQKKKPKGTTPAPAAPVSADADADSTPAPAAATPPAPAEGAADQGTPAAGGEPGATPGGEAGGEAGGMDICQITPDAPQCQAAKSFNINDEAKKTIRAEVYAVQQQYVLKGGRFEIQPFFAFTMNDQFVSHDAPGLALNYYLTQVLAVGVVGNWYDGLNSASDFNFQNRRAAHIAVPLNDYQLSGDLNFTYVPMYGKFAGFGDFIFNYDGYIDGGLGVIRTKPIPIIDPDNRLFNWNNLINFDIGIGLRIFFNRWLSANLEFRDIMYFEKIESTTVATGPDVPVGAMGYSASSPTNPATWYDPNTHFTNDIQMQVGLSVFLPTSFEYALPK
jgi:outer membrane beta-barrel protein